MKKYLLIILVAILCLVSCTKPKSNYDESQINTRSEMTQSNESTTENIFPLISFEMALQDYNELWETLELNYPHIETAQSLYGVKYEEVKKQHLSIIESYTDPILIDDYFYDLNSVIEQFNYLGHLTLMNAEYYWGIYEVYESVTKDLDYQTHKDEIDELMSNFNNQHITETYTYLKSNNGNSVDFTTMNELLEDNISIDIIDNDTLYISIASFMDINIEPDKEVFNNIYETINLYDNLIIDVRGNSGGNDDYWMKNIVEPNINQPVAATVYGIGKSDGINNRIYIDNSEEVKAIRNKISNLPNIDHNLFKKMQFANSNVYECNPSQAEKIFNGDIYVLVDNSVYSATEGFVLFCQSTGFAKIVGTQTGGDGGMLKLREFPLMGSGLLIRFSTMIPLNIDGSPNTPYGSTPDYILEKDDDFIQECINIINSK